MSTLDPRLSRWLPWLAVSLPLALAIGLQTGWGGEVRGEPLAEPPVVPPPVTTEIIPEFRIDGAASMKATVERPLFNASRRPAPSAAAEGGKPAIQRGQFLLTGTMITDKGAVAFLKETSGTGKARSVKKGDSINGMLVAEVAPDRVKLTVGDESEDVELKVAKGPKTTVQPAAVVATAPASVPAASQAQGGAVPSAAGAPGRRPQTQAGAQPTDDARENVRAARRAARAAEAQQQSSGQAAQGATANNPQQGTTWSDTYQRMQRRGK